MNNALQIQTYMTKFGHALVNVQENYRTDICTEIRTHLQTRAEAGQLDLALAELGPPEKYAQAFRDELRLQTAFDDGGPVMTLSALMVLASRRVLAALGLFVSGVFFLMAFGFAVTVLVEVVAPDMAGLWVIPDRHGIMMGVLDEASRTRYDEILGRWSYRLQQPLRPCH